MHKLTPSQMLIAAEMCDARRCELTRKSSDDEVEAAAWLFANGILFLGPKGCNQAAIMLRDYAGRAALSEPGHVSGASQ